MAYVSFTYAIISLGAVWVGISLKSTGRALQVVVVAAAVGVSHPDADGRALLFADEEEECLAVVIVAPAQPFSGCAPKAPGFPLAHSPGGVGHGLGRGGCDRSRAEGDQRTKV